MDPTKKELYEAKRDSGIRIDDPIIIEAWQRVRSEEDPTNFLLLRYVSQRDITLLSAGHGGFDELLSKLQDDEVIFGAFRARLNGMTKYFTIMFTGNNVGGMKKGKASLHKAGVLNFFDGSHGEITINNGTEGASRELVINEICRLFAGLDPQSVSV